MTDSSRRGPRWWFFAWFAVLAGAHLAVEGWTDTAAIGLPLGFAATLVLVFVPGLPPWVTGEPAPDRTVAALRRRRAWLTALLVVFSLPVLALVVMCFIEPPARDELADAVFVFALALALPAGFAVALALTARDLRRAAAPPPVRKPLSRWALRRGLQWRTLGVVAAVVAAVALETVLFGYVGGWVPWVVLVPVLIAVLAAWASRVFAAEPLWLLRVGPWTSLPAAAEVRPGGPVIGWTILPDGLRARFTVDGCPPDLLDVLLRQRRLWVAGVPGDEVDEVAVGIPDSDLFAVATLSVKTREIRRRAAFRRQDVVV